MSAWPIEQIRELLEPTIKHMGYELYGLRQMGPGGRTLQIAIDSPEGITLDDCERVSHVAGPLLDQADLIDDGRYHLEVSSPGAERALRNRAEYDRFMGQRVNVKYRSGDGEAVIEGTLVTVDDTGVAVLGRTLDEVRIAWDDVLAARLAIAF
ncbi:MAG TPA: ribosome maturation factor RimP [Candidatus Dormibacteraeota bacterium]